MKRRARGPVYGDRPAQCGRGHRRCGVAIQHGCAEVAGMTPSVLTATPAFLWTQRSQREDAKVAKKRGVLNSFAFFASFFAASASKKTSPGHDRPGNRKAA